MEIDYKELYEKEHQKNAALAERVAALEDANGDLQFKIDRIKKNPLWKVSKPARDVMHAAIRQVDRLRNCGGVRGFLAKLDYKKREKEAMKQFGTDSFPNEEQTRVERETKFAYMPQISILVPLYNTDETMLKEMIDSVLYQTYENWQLCLADGSDAAHAYVEKVCREYMAAEGDRARIVYRRLERNEGISGNTNQCLKLAAGEYIGLFDHDDILHPSVLFEYVKAINEQGADYLYCDETTFKSGDINHMLTMHFKPDYAPDNLRANNYICHFSVFKRTLLEGTELFRSQFDGSQDHDMILRLTDKAKKVVHIPKLMYYWRCHPASVASNIGAKTYCIDAARGAIADHLRSHGYDHFKITSTRAFETIFKIRYEIMGSPKISIVIANKDHAVDLKRCISSIYEKSTYDNWEIIVVENNSTEDSTWAYYKELTGKDVKAEAKAARGKEMETANAKEAKKASDADRTGTYTGSCSTDGKVRVVVYETDGSFNYSAVNNYGASFAAGEYILLLNNDTEVITVNWLEELLMYAQREDVGAVGGKLYYPDKTIQHAGVVLALGAHRTAGHSHYKQPKANLGYMGRLCYAQNVSAVTGACLMVKKTLFDQVGGLEESFAISLNDVDFCLKLRAKGYLNVFTPFAECFHYESISRGLDDQGEKAERYNKESEQFRNKWKEVLEAGDPYYNPNFSLDRSDFSLKVQN